MFKNTEEREKHWNKYAKDRLVGRSVVSVRYLTAEEAEDMGWYSRSLVIAFDDGSYIFPSQDDEGNDGGALFGGDGNVEDWTFPVIGR